MENLECQLKSLDFPPQVNEYFWGFLSSRIACICSPYSISTALLDKCLESLLKRGLLPLTPELLIQ